MLERMNWNRYVLIAYHFWNHQKTLEPNAMFETWPIGPLKHIEGVYFECQYVKCNNHGFGSCYIWLWTSVCQFVRRFNNYLLIYLRVGCQMNKLFAQTIYSILLAHLAIGHVMCCHHSYSVVVVNNFSNSSPLKLRSILY